MIIIIKACNHGTTSRDGVGGGRVVARVLGHEVFDELHVRVTRSLHARLLPLLFLCTHQPH